MPETAVQTRLHRAEQGRIWIEDSGTKLILIAADKYAHGWSAEEIQAQLPQLSRAQTAYGPVRLIC